MTKHQTTGLKSQSGFTLVELAIVLIIIGLLIGGVLKGQALIGNAQITSTVAQIKGIEAATTTFKDQFGQLPGDLPNANNRITNCAGACYVAANVGDGKLQNTPKITPTGTEGEAFSLQLFDTNLISGLQPQPGQATSSVIGTNFPATKIGGGVILPSYSTGLNADFPTLVDTAMVPQQGLYLTISGSVAVPTNGVTGVQAGAIDSKIDDGQPDAGTVFAGPAACGTKAAGTVAGYYAKGNGPICVEHIRIQN